MEKYERSDLNAVSSQLNLHFNCICKDPISKYSHLRRDQVLGFQHIGLGTQFNPQHPLKKNRKGCPTSFFDTYIRPNFPGFCSHCLSLRLFFPRSLSAGLPEEALRPHKQKHSGAAARFNTIPAASMTLASLDSPGKTELCPLRSKLAGCQL